MAIGSSWLATITDSVFDGTSAGDVTTTTVSGQTHDLTGALSAMLMLHADNQDGTPEDNIRFDIYTGVNVSGAEMGITPSDSVTLPLVIAGGGVDPNSIPITLFPVPNYVQVKATRVNGAAGADTIRCRVRLAKQQGNTSA